MTDFVTDGTRVWARVKWRLKGGRTIDPAKTMLVDSGMIFTGISASNLDPDLKIIGLVTVSILGCVGDGLVLDGGEMSLEIEGKVVSCSKPVVYSPCYLSDFMGLDQMLELGLLRGITVKRATPFPFFTFPPERLGDLYPFIGPLLTIRPGTNPVRLTPRPGLFAFLGPLAPQGTFAAAGWELTQFWEQAILTGKEFDIAVAFVTRKPQEFAFISFEIPHGFKVVTGDVSRSIASPQPGHVEEIHLRILAPAAAGDYFWRTTIRAASAEGEVAKSVDGRIAVRDQILA